MTSLIGQTINNRYKLEALLGDGGMGAVYRAHDLNLDRQVAIKVMHAHFARKQEFRARLVQEAQTAARLDHPSVVQIHDFGNSEAGLFITMEFVSGGSLRDHLRRLQTMGKYLPLAQSLQIAAQIADALDYAHRRGIVHRDVKPGNVLLKRLTRPDAPGEQPFRAMLTDFGLVKLQEGSDMTQSGATLGTPTYMSPEQCRGDSLDGRTDIYSLGVVLYELVTNRLPFAMKTLTEALAVHDKGEMPLPAGSARADLPAIIDDILMKALAKKRDDRYLDAAAMANALQEAVISLQGAPTQIMHREEVDILEQVKEPPPGHELHIETPGHSTSVFALTQAVVTLGRNADNDVVLPAEGVSRHHARLQATALGWEVVDLGGINGTWLDERRLRASDATPLAPGSRLRVGPYELVLQGPEIAIQAADDEIISGETTPALDTAASLGAASSAPTEPLGLFLPADKISVEPGRQVELKVEVVNRSERADRVSLQVHGVPASWIRTPGEFTAVPAGETAQLSVVIQPPRQRNTPTGRQRLRLDLISQQHPQLKLGATASLMLGGFIAFDARMEPEQVRLPGLVVVSIENTGNTAADFSLVARDRQRALRFNGERGRIRLQPGQVANVELELEARQRGLTSSGELLQFEVEVASETGDRQKLRGEVRPGTLIPPGVLYALLFIVTVACVLGALALLTNRDRLVGEVEPPPSPTALFFEATGTSAAATQTIAAATNIAATAVVEGDADRDGLSNAQEALSETDPNNPDTDGDGLSDGDEVFVYVTNPSKRDTDGDILYDGDEVNIYKTSPRLADTDGDGISDGAEITQGTDPLVAETPTPGPTETVAPTEDVTPSATLPSATPTQTGTPPPSATTTPTPTATHTATATATPTTTFTPTNTATPTETPPPTETPTITPTPTNTPIPAPVIACLAAPPTVDGIFQVAEWPGSPLFQFQPGNNAARLVQVYVGRDAANFYLAFLINDDTDDATDSLRLYVDTTNNDGDPDTADRFFQIGRDQSLAVWAGTGSNSDGKNWNSDYDSDQWTAVIGEPGSDQWVVEMSIAAAEFSGLANPFGLMTQVVYTGELATWPESASSFDPGSWQDVEDAVCP